MLSVNFYKNEKMFQIDLNSNLKKERHLQVYITLNRSQSQRG